MNLNEHITKESAQLALIEQGYAHTGYEDALDTHPVYGLYEDTSGELLPQTSPDDVHDEKSVAETQDTKPTAEEIGRIARRALSYVVGHDGVVMTEREVEDARRPDTTRERVGRY